MNLPSIKRLLAFLISLTVLTTLVLFVRESFSGQPEPHAPAKISRIYLPGKLDWDHKYDVCNPTLQDQLLGLLNKAEIILTLLDPRILSQFLSSEEHLRLQLRDINIETSSAVSTLGIDLNDALPLIKNEQLLKSTKKLGFQMEVLVGTDGRVDQTMNTTSESDNRSIICTHIFYIHEHFLIHIVVMAPWKNFIWISSLPKIPDSLNGKIGRDQLLVSDNELILHTLEKEATHSCQSKFYIPINPLNFIVELTTANFIRCDYDTKDYFHKYYENSAKPNLEYQTQFKETIRELNLALYSSAIPFWMSSGTLLGWYRQCDIIPYTSDLDFSMWIKDFSKSTVLEQFLKENRRLKIKHIYGLPSKAYQFALYFESLRVDLFFVYEEKKHMWFGAHINNKKYFHYLFPKFKLCSGELLGEKVLVPCDPKAIIEAEYGPNWKNPITEWSYFKSPFNMGPVLEWTKEEIEEMKKNQL